MSARPTPENLLGTYLKDRRTKLDPAAFGFPAERRRTPGLRREEVAQRANISPTWYTWLEQGRGGAPSADVLDRIASEKTRRSGLSDSFAYGYLGLTMWRDGHTLYYLTGTPLGEEIRFVTYDTQSGNYTDHGALARAHRVELHRVPAVEGVEVEL